MGSLASGLTSYRVLQTTQDTQKAIADLQTAVNNILSGKALRVFDARGRGHPESGTIR